MDFIEDIGPILGIVAFLGFAILALLIVLQAREVRRLREWAGRAPERSEEADEADRAAAEARGESADGEPGRIAALRQRVAAAVGPRWDELDRRSPVDPRLFAGALLIALIAAGIATGGFGLTGGDEAPTERASGNGERRGGGGREEAEPKAVVAVLNATQIDDPVAPVDAVPGIADVVAEQVVKPEGYKIGQRTNAPAGEAKTLIMFQPDASEEAGELADAVQPKLGETGTAAITDDVSVLAGNADLVLLVGQDDATFGQ